MSSRPHLSLSFIRESVHMPSSVAANENCSTFDVQPEPHMTVLPNIRKRERSVAAAELEVWKQKAGGGNDGGLESKQDASLRQSRSEIVASEAAR
eukprot:COSAG02_NODE_1645_length_11523_cov_10.783876_7_plen_95_part_00